MDFSRERATMNSNFLDDLDKETFTVDPLVLAVACKDLATINIFDTHSLNSSRVIEYVNDSHRAHAEKIREYYCKKVFWDQLKTSNEISDYRKRMFYLLENKVKECKGQDTGIYYTLPYFYDEDCLYDEFKKTYTVKDLPVKTHYDKPTLSLIYLDKSIKYQKRDKKNFYWFTNGQYLFSIDLDRKNPLLELFEERLSKGLTTTFKTYYTNTRIADMQYYKLFNFSLIKD